MLDEVQSLLDRGGRVDDNDHSGLQESAKQLPAALLQPVKALLTPLDQALHLGAISLVGAGGELDVHCLVLVPPAHEGKQQLPSHSLDHQ